MCAYKTTISANMNVDKIKWINSELNSNKGQSILPKRISLIKIVAKMPSLCKEWDCCYHVNVNAYMLIMLMLMLMLS